MVCKNAVVRIFLASTAAVLLAATAIAGDAAQQVRGWNDTAVAVGGSSFKCVTVSALVLGDGRLLVAVYTAPRVGPAGYVCTWPTEQPARLTLGGRSGSLDGVEEKVYQNGFGATFSGWEQHWIFDLPATGFIQPGIKTLDGTLAFAVADDVAFSIKVNRELKKAVEGLK